MNKFDLDKLYLFSKEKYRQYTGKIKPLAELLDKRIVDVEDEWTGTITVGGEDYIVFPHSCIEISPEVYSDESGNIYNEIEDKQEEQDENSITSFLDKLLSLDLSDNEEEERYDDKLDKFDMNKRYVFDKTLIGADINADDWIDRINGKEVDVKSPLLGYIYDEESRFNYFISPRWTRILKED